MINIKDNSFILTYLIYNYLNINNNNVTQGFIDIKYMAKINKE